MERSYGEVYWTFLQDILYSQSFPIFVIYLTFVTVMTSKPYRKYMGNAYKDAPESKSFERYIKYVRSYSNMKNIYMNILMSNDGIV